MDALPLRPGAYWLFIFCRHLRIDCGQRMVTSDFHLLEKWAQKLQKTCDFHTFFYIPCLDGGVDPSIEKQSLLHPTLGFKAHSTKNRARLAYANVEHECDKNRLFVTVRASSWSPPPLLAPKKNLLCLKTFHLRRKKNETFLWRLEKPRPAEVGEQQGQVRSKNGTEHRRCI